MKKNDNNKRTDNRAKKLVKVNTKQTSPEVASKAGSLLRRLGSQSPKPPSVRDILSSIASALSQASGSKKPIVGIGNAIRKKKRFDILDKMRRKD